MFVLMENLPSIALYILTAFYVVYVVTAAFLFTRTIRSTRRKALYIRHSKFVGESGKVNISLEVLLVSLTVIISVYVMGRWLFEQLIIGCMHVGFWNPACYDMNYFNRSWLAVFVVVAINAMMITLVLDTKRQNKKFNR